MTRRSRLVVALVAGLALLVAGVLWLTRSQAPSRELSASRPGTIVTTIRSDPRTFNPLLGRDVSSDLIGRLTQATLVRLNRETDQIEPWLADTWTSSDDGLRYTMQLRPDAVFCDGQPVSADDVAFSFQALYDDRVGSVLTEPLLVQGQPIRVEVDDPTTVTFILPAPYGPGLRLLKMVPIVPRHLLEAAFEAGTLRDAWSLAAPVANVCGAGPFVIEEYVSGQRLVLGRNQHYWLHDEQGVRLPYLDRIVLEIVPDQNVEVLRLETGEVDFISSELRPEDYPAIKREADEGRLRLFDLGPGLDPDFLWFNLKRRAVVRDRAWVQHKRLRYAIAHAINRRAFANTVFLGQGVRVHGPITPANEHWYSPDVPRRRYKPARAHKLLDQIGLRDRDGDGWREDRTGERARFTLLSQKGHTLRERAVAVIQQDLQKIGLQVDVVPLEFGTLVERITNGRYEAAYLGLRANDTDPAMNLDFWLSSGAFHFWRPVQPQPATEWERRIDELMREHVAVSDLDARRASFTEVQVLFADYAPALYFAVPRVTLAVNPRVRNVRPSVMAPQILWNAERLAVSPAEP